MYKLGIIGFGVVGKSILTFLNRQKIDSTSTNTAYDLYDDTSDLERFQVRVWDSRALVEEEQEIIKMYKATAVDSGKVPLKDFIKENDFVIASPGVNLNNHKEFDNKFLCELDFFSVFFNKPVIAITGSLGKTTITKLLGRLTKASAIAPASLHPIAQGLGLGRNMFPNTTIRSAFGGNVGIGMLDLVQQQDDYDLGILELSSFQLELNKKFAPDIALWTNWYPNHLDRHQTPLQYFEAKFNLLRFQHEHQIAILSDELFKGECGSWFNERMGQIKSKLCICSMQKPHAELLATIKHDSFYVFYKHDQWLEMALVEHGKCGSSVKLFNMQTLPDITFVQNWIQILTALYALGVDLYELQKMLVQQIEPLLADHHHRLEHFVTVNGVDFYDDSKSTVIQSTIAAFEKLSALNRPIILIVGGLGKGVDRSPLITAVNGSANLKKLYCFGKDCGDFQGCTIYPTLVETVREAMKIAKSGDIVLFSPSGASFDLFKNYEHRGQVFRELVVNLGSLEQSASNS